MPNVLSPRDLKGVKKVRSAVHRRIVNHLKKEMMLRKCIVIPCDTLRRLISCLTSTDVTQLFLHSVLSFNRSRKSRNFP